MSQLLAVLVVLVFVAAGLFFGSLNSTPVVVDYFFFQANAPLAFSLISFLLSGIVVGAVCVYVAVVVKLQHRLRASRRASKQLAVPDE